MRRGLGFAAAGALLLPSTVHADTAELSLRPALTLERTTAHAEGQETTAFLVGPDVVAGVGLTPALTLTARYAYTRSGLQSVKGTDPRTRQTFELRRHTLLGGVFFAPSDELTPLFGVELGAVRTGRDDRQWRLSTPDGERRVPPFLTDRTAWNLAVRGSAALEWRFRGTYSLIGGLGMEWAGGVTLMATLGLSGYRYF